MNPECIGCPTGKQLRESVITAHIARRESTEQLELFDGQIKDCSIWQILKGTRRRLQKARQIHLDTAYYPASQDYIQSFGKQNRLELCAGPFSPAAIGIENCQEPIACGTEVVGIRVRLAQVLSDNDAAANNPLPIVEDC